MQSERALPQLCPGICQTKPGPGWSRGWSGILMPQTRSSPLGSRRARLVGPLGRPRLGSGTERNGTLHHILGQCHGFGLPGSCADRTHSLSRSLTQTDTDSCSVFLTHTHTPAHTHIHTHTHTHSCTHTYTHTHTHARTRTYMISH